MGSRHVGGGTHSFVQHGTLISCWQFNLRFTGTWQSGRVVSPRRIGKSLKQETSTLWPHSSWTSRVLSHSDPMTFSTLAGSDNCWFDSVRSVDCFISIFPSPLVTGPSTPSQGFHDFKIDETEHFSWTFDPQNEHENEIISSQSAGIASPLA